ncbi:S1 family peptidase [Nonomuraea sp. NPDC052116]|uniref:S1 family peptidase n=1 Tax=Nonomuraea sp. NPDC052116 TaxID=3155665 RepID=UPI00342BFCC6
MRGSSRVIVVASLAALVGVLTGTANAADQKQDPEPTAKGRLAFTLSADSQPHPARSTLQSIQHDAEVKGISIEEALKRYAGDAVNKRAALQAPQPDGPVPDPDIKIDGIPYAELIDLQRLAKGKGITFAEAIERYSWTPAVNAVAQQLKQRFPNDLAGLAITNEGRGVRIGFKGAVPDDAVALARSLPVEVNLFSDRGFTELELQATLDAAAARLRGRSDIAMWVGKYNAETGQVSFALKPRPETMRSDSDSLRASIASEIGKPSNPNIDVALKIDTGPGIRKEDKYLRGGGLLNASFLCTNGFNIQNVSTGATASATARHCADKVTYYTYKNHPSYDTETTTISRFFRATDYDIARYESGDMTRTRTFYYDWNLPRYADDVGTSPVIGQPVCKFGRTSGATCDDITDVNVTVDYGDGKTYRGNIETDDMSDGGDSGGPWYYGNRAWGIHSGGTDCTVCDTASYAVAADRLNDAGGMGSNWQIWTR